MQPTVTSPQNPRVKEAAKLRDRRGRAKQNRIIIDGVREISRAIEAGVRLDEVFFDQRLRSQAERAAWIDHVAAAGAVCLPVGDRVLEKLAFGERGDGIVATACTPRRSLDGLSLPENPLLVVLERVEKPGNLGAVMRTADAVGASAVIAADGGTDLFNPNAIRASLGAIFTVPVCEASSGETRRWLEQQRVRILAARVDGSTEYWRAELTGPLAIVLGSEASGLSQTWSGPGVSGIRLPMRGRIDSLNVSTTAAVLLYEAVRQRATAWRNS